MEKQLIPKLRFPEFKGNWKENILDNIATFSKGKGISKADIDENGKYECIRYGELYTVYSETINKVKSKTNLSSSELVFSEANDIIIPASGETQIDIATASCVLRTGIALGGDLNIIKTKTNGVFLSYYLNNKKKHEIAKLSQGNSVVHLYGTQLKSLKINLPQSDEQQKITSFLTSVDTHITLLTQQKEKLELYKKGIMQQLFSQEIRFKDDNGNIFPEWEDKIFNEIIERTSTGLNPRQNFTLGKGNNYYVTIKNISNGKLDFKSCEMINDDALNLIKKRSNLSKNDIIMSSIGNIGEAYLLKEEPINWNINESVFMIRSKKEVVMPLFLYYILSNDYTKRYFENNMTGSSFKSIKIGDLKLMPVKIPCKEEQQKIADFLNAIDNQIEQVGKQIDRTVEFKKGLLQQMFV